MYRKKLVLRRIISHSCWWLCKQYIGCWSCFNFWLILFLLMRHRHWQISFTHTSYTLLFKFVCPWAQAAVILGTMSFQLLNKTQSSKYLEKNWLNFMFCLAVEILAFKNTPVVIVLNCPILITSISLCKDSSFSGRNQFQSILQSTLLKKCFF